MEILLQLFVEGFVSEKIGNSNGSSRQSGQDCEFSKLFFCHSILLLISFLVYCIFELFR